MLVAFWDLFWLIFVLPLALLILNLLVKPAMVLLTILHLHLLVLCLFWLLCVCRYKIVAVDFGFDTFIGKAIESGLTLFILRLYRVRSFDDNTFQCTDCHKFLSTSCSFIVISSKSRALQRSVLTIHDSFNTSSVPNVICYIITQYERLFALITIFVSCVIQLCMQIAVLIVSW